MLAEGRIEPDFAVALAQVIAFAVGTAFVRTAGLDDRRNGNALLIDAHLPTKKKKTINQNFSRNKVTQKKKRKPYYFHIWHHWVPDRGQRLADPNRHWPSGTE